MALASPLSTLARLLQAAIAALLAGGLVQACAFLSALTFDRLPKFLDVLFVLFVYPFAVLVLLLLLDGKLLSRIPSWLRRGDGGRVPLPEILMIAVLGGSLAGIYPGIFPYRQLLHLTRDGAALDVVADAETTRRAGYYRFRDSTFRPELGGYRTRVVSVRDGGVRSTARVKTHVSPIVGPSWSPREEIVFWLVAEGEAPPWSSGVESLQGVRDQDERSHGLRAVVAVAAARGLEVADDPVLLTLGEESYELVVSRSRRTTWLVLAPLTLLFAVGAGGKAWAELGRTARPRAASPPSAPRPPSARG